MNYYTEPQKRIPVRAEVDVLVAGGGTAGFAAAIAAARQGVRTMLIERYGYPGGMFTGGFVWWVDGLRGKHPESGAPVLVVRGILHELEKRVAAAGALRGWIFEPETNKFVMMQMMAEAGVHMLYHAWAVDVIKEGNTVTGVIIESKSGREAVLARVVVDCTGDADLACRAGVPCRNCQHWAGPALNYVTQLPPDAAEWFRKHADEVNAFAHEQRERVRREQEIPADAFPVPFVPSPFRPGEKEVYSNTLFGPGYDMIDVADLARFEHEARQIIFGSLKRWQERFPAGKDAVIRMTAPQAGVRETRRIRGEHILTAADILALRRFDDVVTKGPVFWEYSHVLDVPFRCLVPVGVDNLLVAGRCLSATRQAADATRIIPTCVGMGQAAGVAAAMAARNQREVRAVDITELHCELRRQDVELDLYFNAEQYSEVQQQKFAKWFTTLRDVYHYPDEW
jgi:hypothetical protein